MFSFACSSGCSKPCTALCTFRRGGDRPSPAPSDTPNDPLLFQRLASATDPCPRGCILSEVACEGEDEQQHLSRSVAPRIQPCCHRLGWLWHCRPRPFLRQPDPASYPGSLCATERTPAAPFCLSGLSADGQTRRVPFQPSIRALGETRLARRSILRAGSRPAPSV